MSDNDWSHRQYLFSEDTNIGHTVGQTKIVMGQVVVGVRQRIWLGVGLTLHAQLGSIVGSSLSLRPTEIKYCVLVVVFPLFGVVFFSYVVPKTHYSLVSG